MTKEIERLSGKEIYTNRWMSLREDRVRFPNGHEGIYGVVDKPDFALIVPVHGDGRIQMVEQYRYPVSERLWEVPMGSWESDPNVDPAILARAELEEETGFKAGDIEHFGYFYQASGIINQGYHAYLATDLQQGQVQHDQEEQGMVTQAFHIDEIVAMISSGQIKDAPSVAAIGYLRLVGKL